jgi:hypothetical protein
MHKEQGQNSAELTRNGILSDFFSLRIQPPEIVAKSGLAVSMDSSKKS